MRFIVIGFIVGMMCIVTLAGKPMIKIDFEKRNQIANDLSGHKSIEIVDKEGVDESKALKVAYVGYDRGSQRVTKKIRLPKKVEEATLVFDIKFDKKFQFVRGGKLHGFGPKKSITGGKSMEKDGWSARMMWRANGTLNSYVYCQNKKSKYGVSGKSKSFCFIPGKYYAVTMQVKINTPANKANGSILIYINGRKITTHNELKFRGVEGDNTLINYFLFSTFHGGSSPKWAPKKGKNYTTVFAYYDNIAVYKGKHLRKKPGDWSNK